MRASLPSKAEVELSISMEDRRWRIEQHLWIKNKEGQIVPFRPLRTSQLKVLNLILHLRKLKIPVRIIILKSRQTGVSTLVEADMYFEVLDRGIDGMVIAHKEKTSSKIHRMTKLFHEKYDLPKPHLKTSNKEELTFFDHQGVLDVETANDKFAGSGVTPQYIHSTEEPKWKRGDETAISLFQALGYKPGTAHVRESTANGFDPLFHPAWEDATAGCRVDFDDNLQPVITMLDRKRWNYFYPVFISATDDPDCFHEFSSAAEKAIFADTLDEDEKFILKQVPGATLEYLNFRRFAIKNRCRGDLDTYHQEYPECLTADTKISTEGGIIPITEASAWKTTESGLIQQSHIQPIADIYKLVTRCGRVLRGTGNHPVAIVDDGFKDLSELQPGDKIALQAPRFADHYFALQYNIIPTAKVSVVIDEQFGRLIGYFMGDGSWHKDCLSVVCDANDMDVVEDVEKHITACVALPRRRMISRAQGRRGACEVRVNCVAARTIFQKLGLIKSEGDHYRRTVSVPECIFTSPKSVVREFLRGLFESDGSASNRIVRFASCKIDFVRDVQLLLLGFEINSTISTSSKVGGNGTDYTTHALQLSAVHSWAFHNEIGFISRRKSAQKAIPVRPSRSIGMWDEVRSVERHGREHTYNLTIHPTSVFSANGILTHNTPAQAFLMSGRPRFDRKALLLMPIETGKTGRLDYKRTGWERVIFFKIDPGEFLTVFREPVPGHKYVIGTDVSEGLLPDGCKDPDSTVSTVWDITTGMDQVATLDGPISEEQLPAYLNLLGRWYSTAFQVIEINAGGIAVAPKLVKDFNYPPDRIFHKNDWQQESSGGELGWRTTVNTRHFLVQDLADYIREMEITIRDVRTQKECMAFVRKEKGRVEAQTGSHDDHVLSAGLGIQGKKAFPRYNSEDFMRARQKQAMMLRTGQIESGADDVTGY